MASDGLPGLRDDFDGDVSHLSEEIAYHLGAVVNGLAFRRKGRNWQLVIRVRRNGAAKVGFVDGATMRDCLRIATCFVQHLDLKLYDDRFA